MSDYLPAVPPSVHTERYGIHFVGLQASHMKMIFREVSNTDLGIDGYLEVVVDGSPIGLIAVQVKSGKKYFRAQKPTHFVFYAQKKHVRYWLNYRLPVIIIVCDPETQTGYWHYIQDYFKAHDTIPSTNKKVPIPISWSNTFDCDASERLVEIAGYPDSTAPAMLALRASRYPHTRELLTRIELIELYVKRQWLGDWLPLNPSREQILLHSALAGRGPAWYWFRTEAQREYLPHLKSALKQPDMRLQHHAALALVVAQGRHAIDDLLSLLERGGDSFLVLEVLATIPDLTLDDIDHVATAIWASSRKDRDDWSSQTWLKWLSLIAKIGGSRVREDILTWYCRLSPTARSYPLPNAGYLWDQQEVGQLRAYLSEAHPALRTLAISALAEIGERQDLEHLVDYVKHRLWLGSDPELEWLANQMVRLFEHSDLEHLVPMLREGGSSAFLADRVLPALCRKLETSILCQLLVDSRVLVRSYAAEGLAVTNRRDVLLGFATDLHRDLEGCLAEDAQEDFGVAWDNARRIVVALAATGEEHVVERLIEHESPIVRKAVAQGLQFAPHPQAYNYLFRLIQDEDATYAQACLRAGESLAQIGNDQTLHQIVDWLQGHLHTPQASVMAKVLWHLDRRLYGPVQWPIRIGSDFLSLWSIAARDDV